MKYALLLLITACAGGGGGSSSGTGGINGTFQKRYANPALNETVFFSGGHVQYYSGSCNFTGSFSVSGSYISVQTSGSSGCGSVPSSFSCYFEMPTGDYIDLQCTGVAVSGQYIK